MNMASTSQHSSCFFPLSLKSIDGVSSSSSSYSSSKPNLFISTNFKTHSLKPLKITVSSTNSDSQSSLPTSEDQNSYPISDKSFNYEEKNSNPISQSVGIEAENKGSVSKDAVGGKKEIPLALKVAMEKAKEYKKKKGEAVVGSSTNVKEEKQGLNKAVSKRSEKRIVEEKVSSIDFVGLNFSDKKKSRGLPAGLVPMENNFSEKALSEVEMIIGDTSKFGPAAPPELNKQDDSDLYKPKVSTWGVFPRPNNISKTFGGGRTICPGDVLETAEDKTTKDARTRKLLAEYKKKTGLNIDPKLKSSCEKALKDGDTLMDKGKLKDALPFYEKVMKDLPFQTELHGLAALQWSICQDSLSRQAEAKVMYEKLQSHPNAPVKKKAQQFLFGFQAMEILKVKNSSLNVTTTDYRNYFEAFVQDKPNYPLRARAEEQEEENGFQQVLPYILFLACPFIFVLVLVARKGV